MRGIHRSPVNSPHKGQWRGALMFSLICVWINDWVNNRETGNLRRYRAHYDVIVMTCMNSCWLNANLSVRKIRLWKEMHSKYLLRNDGQFVQAMFMMTSSNGDIFHVTGHFCGEFTGPRWIPRTKANDAGLWCFLWSATEYTVEKTIVKLVIWDAIPPIVTSS